MKNTVYYKIILYRYLFHLLPGHEAFLHYYTLKYNLQKYFIYIKLKYYPPSALAHSTVSFVQGC